MLEAFPETRVGDPVRCDYLTVFPLFTTTTSPLAYLMADEAMTAGLVVVEEVSEGGSVPVLNATNRAQSPVLFLEGEELRGAKQNRILNTTILVAARGRAAIWERVEAAGLGTEYRTTAGHLLGTALVVDGSTVHLSLVAAR